MYSNIVRFIFSLTGLAPIFLSCWLVKTIQNIDNLTWYLSLSSVKDICNGIENIIENHYLLFLFIVTVIVCKFLMNHAIGILPIGSIEVKSIKPVDANFNVFLFSYILPWFKFFVTDSKDWIFLLGTILIYLAMTILWKSTYHYSLINKFLLGYRNYEITTVNGVTYLMLSKEKLVNPRQIDRYVQLLDYMIINVSMK